MNRILVPLNLHSDFENILEYAKSVAEKSQAHLTIFYVGGKRVLNGSSNFIYYSEAPLEHLFSQLKKGKLQRRVETICYELWEEEIDFRFKFVGGTSVNEIIRETEEAHYDLVIMGTDAAPGLRGYISGAGASKLIGEIKPPVFVVPSKSRYNEIQHITYAVDFTDYDPNIIKQVKSIASMFDAKLYITHVNAEDVEERDKYLVSLEKTISDTLDYPKIYYKFFDHADPLGGIVKFVTQNNSNLVAMINRRKFSWRELFTGQSLTRKMAKELSVPVLAFRKY